MEGPSRRSQIDLRVRPQDLYQASLVVVIQTNFGKAVSALRASCILRSL